LLEALRRLDVRRQIADDDRIGASALSGKNIRCAGSRITCNAAVAM